eukprot:COSAG02_NODE_2851_length_7896_cov_28.878928_9_plen_59_part_00
MAASASDWDVVVYGSTPAGIAAATAAGQLGLKVAVYLLPRISFSVEHRPGLDRGGALL